MSGGSVGRINKSPKEKTFCKNCRGVMIAVKNTGTRFDKLCLKCKEKLGYIKRNKVIPLWDLKSYRKEEE